ncbi:MAG TPA: primosomal protein N' [Clostridia bacterium]|nr:primosomal protein N' [Clostridia bacterium]
MKPSNQERKRFCRLVLADGPRAIDRSWTYAIPESLSESVEVGSAVLVPFGSRKQPARAFVTHLADQLPEALAHTKVKEIHSLISPRPAVTEEQIALALEMKRRCYCTTGDALNAMVPPVVLAMKDRSVMAARLIDRDEAGDLLDSGDLSSMKQVRVIELLMEHESAACVEIRQAIGISQSVLQTLARKNIIEFFRQKTPRQLPEEAEPAAPTVPPTLTAAQEQAVESIERAALSTAPRELTEMLLFGVTGSGKTEVYLRAAERALARGRQVLILVPEIALTPQMTRRLTSRFGDRVAILHSRLTPAGRYATWQGVLSQQIPIVVGARSAVFAPLTNIGLIVVDEEQESSYKAEMKPRYYAPDIARMRAMMNGAVLVLGSATPQVSSFWRALHGPAVLLRLPDRIGDRGLPDVEVLDMRREYAAGNLSLFSRRFQDLLTRTVESGEQAMILLNRRGFSRTVICRACGWQMRCPSCDISLTSHINPYAPHQIPRRMVCHLCDRISPVPLICPDCGSDKLASLGAGTQQVEEALSALLPAARILRMDQDTTRGRFSHRELLDAFESKQADILVGTQMIAKGHDFHNVTLSAILSADQLLGTGEFRASEQAFQLMTQAAGRSGRGRKKGRVIIQALQPDHFVVKAAANQDYERFYREEIIFRERMGYLPFGHIAMAEFKGFDACLTEDAAKAFHAEAAALISQYGGTFADTVLAAVAPAPISKIRNRYRYRVIARDPSAQPLTRLMFLAADGMKRRDHVAVAIDIDPWSTL